VSRPSMVAQPCVRRRTACERRSQHGQNAARAISILGVKRSSFTPQSNRLSLRILR
jgi:hypothetical protein